MIELVPIRTEDQYEAALEEIEELFEAEPGSPEEDRAAVLAMLLEDYEEQHPEIPSPDPIEAVLAVMASRELSHADMEPFFGSRATVTAVLNHRRALTLDMIRALTQLGIPAHILIQPYRLKRTAKKIKNPKSGTRERASGNAQARKTVKPSRRTARNARKNR